MRIIKYTTITILTAAVAVMFFVFPFCAATQKHEHTCVVTDKYIKNNRKDSRYLIVCDNETYKIEDDTFEWKFDASDTYAKIKIGSTYKLKTKGTRINFISEYENVLEVQ